MYKTLTIDHSRALLVCFTGIRDCSFEGLFFPKMAILASIKVGEHHPPFCDLKNTLNYI